MYFPEGGVQWMFSVVRKKFAVSSRNNYCELHGETRCTGPSAHATFRCVRNRTRNSPWKTLWRQIRFRTVYYKLWSPTQNNENVGKIIGPVPFMQQFPWFWSILHYLFALDFTPFCIVLGNLCRSFQMIGKTSFWFVIISLFTAACGRSFWSFWTPGMGEH